ncbi:MAG: hypothetical protein JWN72_2193 [Thermoleophilia bacterium]|nr:hypothetical protein [Thermoleophilia bacterium]
MRHVLTPANLIATLALLLSLTGTSYAAVKITGAQITNESITGAKIKNNSIAISDLAGTTVASLRGFTGTAGDRGFQGPSGPRGATGPKGDAGNVGAPARLVSSYAQEKPGFDANSLQEGYDRYVSPNGTTPNASSQPWYAYNNQSGDDGIDMMPADAIDGRYTQPTLNGALLDGVGQTNLLSLTDGQANGGQLNVKFNSFITGNASITLLHRGTTHTRAECRLFVSENSTLTAIGSAVWVSANQDYQVVTVGLVGTAPFSASDYSPAQYNVIVRCRDGDKTPSDEWEYVRGNLTAFAALR